MLKEDESLEPVSTFSAGFLSGLTSSSKKKKQTSLETLRQAWEAQWEAFVAGKLTREIKYFLDELDKLTFSPDNFKMSPYEFFWGKHKHNLPVLWELARVVLCPPASTVSVEGLFSVVNMIDTPRRNRLSDRRLGQIVLVNSWRGRSSATKPTVIEWPVPDVEAAYTSFTDIYSSPYVTAIIEELAKPLPPLPQPSSSSSSSSSSPPDDDFDEWLEELEESLESTRSVKRPKLTH